MRMGHALKRSQGRRAARWPNFERANGVSRPEFGARFRNRQSSSNVLSRAVTMSLRQLRGAAYAALHLYLQHDLPLVSARYAAHPFIHDGYGSSTAPGRGWATSGWGDSRGRTAGGRWSGYLMTGRWMSLRLRGQPSVPPRCGSGDLPM